MSYNQKQPGSSGSGMGGGPPNGPNNMPQVAKTFAGIQQQMQNLVHGQNAIPQSSQADINAFLQQQRIQNMLKQQQQFLQFQHQMQQQQQHQHHSMPGGGSVGPGSVGVVAGVGSVTSPSSGAAGSSGEPLALTRTAGAAELLNKTYQQQANGNPAANSTFNQLQQTLQALPTNFVQQLQVFQYQMQAKQMQQQQHGSGQGQHCHGQQQPIQGVSASTPSTNVISHQQQQQQKHQNQQQQQQNALSRYLTAAAAQAAVASGNKITSATPPPSLTNQMKPPNLPPNTQITPVTASNVVSSNIPPGTNSKISTGNANTSVPPPSISVTPSKATSSPSIAHQQNKFTPPTSSGQKAAHLSYSQNLQKSTHSTTNTATNTTTSPAKAVINADVTVAALKSPQSTPVQLTKQLPPVATTAATGNKTFPCATTTTGTIPNIVSPIKSTVATPASSLTSISANISTSSNITTGPNITTTSAYSTTKLISCSAIKSDLEEVTATKLPLKSFDTEKGASKLSLNDINYPSTGSSGCSYIDDAKKEIEKSNDMKFDTAATAKIPAITADEKDHSDTNHLKSNTTSSSTSSYSSTLSSLETKVTEEITETSVKSKKMENHHCIEDNGGEKNKTNWKKVADKNECVIADEKNNLITQVDAKPSQALSDDKDIKFDLKQTRNITEEKKLSIKAQEKDKANKSNKSLTKNDQLVCVTSKENQKCEADDDKLVTLETKTIPTATTDQIASIESSEKDKLNANNSKEVKIKKYVSEDDEIKQAEKLPAAVVADSECVEAAKTCTPMENEGSLTAKKSTENSESGLFTEEAQVSSKVNTQNYENNSIVNSVSAVVTPVKKVARFAKGVKSKALPSTIAIDIKTKDLQDERPAVSSTRVKRKLKADNLYPLDSAFSTSKEEDLDKKPKRHRLKTILYQSPLPELAYITKLSASEASNSPKPMSNEDRLIVFYKNEYMAVRNAEGTFYLCQTMQNVYRTSPRISIRWLSEDTKDSNLFIPDFYDHTDIECVLTTVELKRIDKGHLRLPKGERNRIESILRKAIDVEKGLLPRPELTEENPDGLDISLFKDESQIEKKTASIEGCENQTPTAAAGRKSRRGNITVVSSARKSKSTLGGNKCKKNVIRAAATFSPNNRKSLSKKRKTLLRRKKNIGPSDGIDDDDNETSDYCESDVEYKPTQKRSSVNAGSASKLAPRAQRSPLAKARAASPITPTTSKPKTVPQKTTPTPFIPKASRGERAAKRKSISDVLSEESLIPIKKTITISNNKSKASDNTSEATNVKKSSLINNSSARNNS